jgi:hypothetical protein
LLLIMPAPQPVAGEADAKLGSGSWVILPLLSRKGCASGLFPSVPTIWPESLIPATVALVSLDRSVVVRSVILLPFHKNASEVPALVCAEPTTLTAEGGRPS